MRVAPSKVFVGLPFYGYEFAANALGGAPVAPAGELDYRDIAGRAGTAGWVKRYDEAAGVPYLTRPSSPGFTSYDDARSIGHLAPRGRSPVAADDCVDASGDLIAALAHTDPHW